MIYKQIKVFYYLLPLLFSACASTAMKPIEAVKQVDLPRFMGHWYVIAAIPTLIEKEVYNGVESYALNTDGSIATTFTFNKGSFNGPVKTYHPTGFPDAKQGNGVWGMQFIWPFKADYRIAYLDADYQTTIIARNARDYVWLMARTPQMPATQYNEMVKAIEGLGYDVSKLRKVPHQTVTEDQKK